MADHSSPTKDFSQVEDSTVALLHALPDPALLIDIDGTICAVNAAAITGSGKPAEELIGTKVYSSRDFSTVTAGLERRVEEVISSKKPLRTEEVHDGRRIDHSLYPVIDKQGKVARIVAITRDITEYRREKEGRQRLSKQVKEQERTFNGILSASDDRVYVFDKDMRYTYINPPGARALGLTPKDIVGKTWKELNIPLEPMRHVIALADTVFATGRSQTGELQWDRADGTAQCYEYIHAPIFNSRGDVVSIVSTFRNITTRKEAEKKLAESEQKYRELVEDSNSIILELDTAGTITFMNEYGLQFFGYTAEELIGRNLIGTIVPEVESTGRNLRALMEDLLSAPDHYQKNVNENITKNGRRIWVSWSNRAITDDSGRIIGDRAIGNDITALKHAEEKLQQAHEKVQTLNEELRLANETLEERVKERTVELQDEIEERKKAEQTYHAVFDGVNDAIFIIDGETGAYLDVNDRACELFGYTIDELQNLSAGDLGSGSGLSTKAHLRNVVAEVWNRAIPHVLEWEAKDKSGRVFWVESNITRAVIGGRPCILSAVRDITERKKAQEQLRAASLYSRNLLEASVDPLVTISAEGKITDVNKATEDVTGYSREELIGTDFSGYFTKPEKAREGYQKVFSEGFVKDYPLAIRHMSGKITDVLYNATVYRNEAGETQGVFAAARDVTEQKQAQKALKRAHDELEQKVKERTFELQQEIEEHKATEEELRETTQELQDLTQELQRSNTELEQFAYIASHDLQEPLRTVTSSIGLLEKGYKDKLGEQADMFINYAVDATKQMQQLIKDLLAYSRVTTRGEVFKSVLCSAAVQHAVDNLKAAIEENGAKIRLPDKPLPMVMGDKTQLIQLFQNLISNAIKFRSEKPPEIQIDAELDGGRNLWQFFVRDNGIGMDMQYGEKIFTIFERLHTTEQYPGTGLGLALCKKIVERHNGEIWVKSELGRGSTFYFTLPFHVE
jgi:PAS domain S-box-containing protein